MSDSAAFLTRPTAPLTILTLSPSCPHAAGPTIHALEHLFQYIPSQQAQAHTAQPTTSTASDNKELHPCETFTLIAGVGFAGASLALFLGRFRMKFEALRAEWQHLTMGVDPDLKRTFSHAGLVGDCLVAACLLLLFGRKRGGLRGLQVQRHGWIENNISNLPRILRYYPYTAGYLKDMLEDCCDYYGTSRRIFLEAPEEIMCRHVVFATAEHNWKKEKKDTKKKKQKSAGYDIFRMHELPPGGGEAMGRVPDPRTTEISFVLDTIAAAEPHTNFKESARPIPMRVSSGEKGKRGAFRIVEIALEELWALYGKDVPIAAIVDIGDGFEEWEEGADLKEVAKCLVAARQQMGGGAAPISSDEAEYATEHSSGQAGKIIGGKDAVQEKSKGKMVESKDTAQQNDETSSTTKVHAEDKFQKDIEAKLREVYGDAAAPPFFRIKGQKWGC
ncbi:MAG: hypothetical protein Q9212_005608 [Teloschistes hypoglaucus]